MTIGSVEQLQRTELRSRLERKLDFANASPARGPILYSGTQAREHVAVLEEAYTSAHHSVVAACQLAVGRGMDTQHRESADSLPSSHLLDAAPGCLAAYILLDIPDEHAGGLVAGCNPLLRLDAVDIHRRCTRQDLRA